jgi:hypothetical protein
MDILKKIEIGETTEALIRLTFDKRIALESEDENLNHYSRAMEINALKANTLAFIKRNPNANFKLVAPEKTFPKDFSMDFSNYSGKIDNPSEYILTINEYFDEVKVTQRVKVGRDIKFSIKIER